jgi:isopentenyldiphosphate isomerase
MEEFFDVVDDGDNVVGRASRGDCHRKHLTHRSVMFFVFDKGSRVFVNKRAGGKEFFGGRRSLVFGGHVPSGESYDEAARRELAEEAGLTDKPFRLGYFKKRLRQENENVMVYGVIATKPVKLLESEVVSGEFMTLAEAEKLIEKEEFIPETQHLLPILRDYLKML